MGNSNCNSSLDPVGLEADQFHVAEDVLNLLVESSRGLLSLANASTCDLINLIDNCLATVPEYLPLVELLLPLCLLLGTDLLFLLNLLPAFVCALFKARQHCMQFLHHSLLPLFLELLLKLPQLADFSVKHFIGLLPEEIPRNYLFRPLLNFDVGLNRHRSLVTLITRALHAIIDVSLDLIIPLPLFTVSALQIVVPVRGFGFLLYKTDEY